MDVYVSKKFLPLKLPNDIPLEAFDQLKVIVAVSDIVACELGRKTPYFRPANFPIEVTCEIEAITTSGDFVSAYEFGDSELYSTVDSGNNVSNEVIFMFMRGGLGLDLGNKNKLSSVSYGGGDAGGGNVSCTYSFSNFNQLDVQDRLNQELLGFGGITMGAGFDTNGLANDIGSGPFPADLVANL